MNFVIHPYADLFPLLEGADLESLVRSIKKSGQRNPIIRNAGDGRIVDGRNRLNACEAAGIVPAFIDVKFESDDEVLSYVVDENLHRRHLSTSQRGLIADTLANMEHGGDRSKGSNDLLTSQADAARAMNVSVPTVKRARALRTEVESGNAPATLIDEVRTGAKTLNAALTEARPHVSHNSGNNEWYTPAKYIKAAADVMGGIDLDPASSEQANVTVGADKYFTLDNSGLDHEWSGKVWLNPPYSSDLVGRFADKLADEINRGEIVSAIVLVNNATETKWFAKFASMAISVCFPLGRIRYLSGDTGEVAKTPLQGQAFFYFGDSPALFHKVFSVFGAVCMVCK